MEDLSVAPPLHLSVPGEEPRPWRCQAAGVDKLELGLWVRWGLVWPRLASQLERARAAARTIDAAHVDLEGLPFIAHARGRSNYRFHLQRLGLGHVYVSDVPRFSNFPNVLVCLDARAIWSDGLLSASQQAMDVVGMLGGDVERDTVSRVDLCADFSIPGGIHEHYFREHLVGKRRLQLDGDTVRFRSYTLGAGSTSIRLAVYDKIDQMRHRPEVQWTRDCWDDPAADDVWRVEFQMRRESLTKRGYSSLSDVSSRTADLWHFLTHRHTKFKLTDNSNVTRCTTEPGWRCVQEAASRFTSQPTRSIRPLIPKDVTPLFNQINGLFVTVGARRGTCDRDVVIEEAVRHFRENWSQEKFASAVNAKRAGMGYEPAAEAA
jgi:hypothetical protein